MWRIVVSCSLLALALCPMAFGQTPSPAPPMIAGAPDVLVLVYQRPGIGDQVDVTYAQTVPHDQVLQDIQALTKETGWDIAPSTVKDAAAPVRSHFGPMTSLTFTAPNVVQNETHTLPVETFARAFRSYKRLNLVFIVSTGFTFQGPRQYADNHIQFTLDQHGAAYTYSVAILNPNFDRLDPAAMGQAQGGGRHRSPWLVLLAIFAAAVGVGLIVFVLAKRLMPPPAPPRLLETEDDSEKSLEAVHKG